jgi:division protein CdvB (Snf7/Vps24/ESCRT-III family)
MQLAKEGQEAAARRMAGELVKIRRARERLTATKGKIQAVSTRAAVSQSTGENFPDAVFRVFLQTRRL